MEHNAGIVAQHESKLASTCPIKRTCLTRSIPGLLQPQRCAPGPKVSTSHEGDVSQPNCPRLHARPAGAACCPSLPSAYPFKRMCQWQSLPGHMQWQQSPHVDPIYHFDAAKTY